MAGLTTLMTLPLEIRLTIWSYCVPLTAEAACCEQASPESPRRLFKNPWYPSSVLPAFAYPEPRIPLRLISRQANEEVRKNIALPPLIARTCDFMCLRRALNILSYRSSTVNDLDLTHITAFKVTSERVKLMQPLYSTNGEETGFTISMKSHDASNQARIQRLAQSFDRELRHYFRDVHLVQSDWTDAESEPFSVEVKMLFEVKRCLRTIVCGDSSRAVVQRTM